MKTRHLLIAVAAAALLAGSSYGALAGQHSFGMYKSGASSFSMIHSEASVWWGTPKAEVFGITKTQATGDSVGSGGSSGTAEANGAGGYNGGFGDFGTLSIGQFPMGGGGSSASATGETGGLSCSGTGCGTVTGTWTNFNTGGGGGGGGRR
jgi:hypothetical protein